MANTSGVPYRSAQGGDYYERTPLADAIGSYLQSKSEAYDNRSQITGGDYDWMINPSPWLFFVPLGTLVGCVILLIVISLLTDRKSSKLTAPVFGVAIASVIALVAFMAMPSIGKPLEEQRAYETVDEPDYDALYAAQLEENGEQIDQVAANVARDGGVDMAKMCEEGTIVYRKSDAKISTDPLDTVQCGGQLFAGAYYRDDDGMYRGMSAESTSIAFTFRTYELVSEKKIVMDLENHSGMTYSGADKTTYISG